MRIPTHYRNKAFKASNTKARELREAIRTARTGGCLIPPNEEDGPCSPDLNNSHLIGINHLKPIAKNGHVYEWDMAQITNATRNWIMHGTLSDELTRNSFGEIHPADINILKCTRRAICTNHDGPVFRAIDRRYLDPGLPEHQFQMGFRGIAGSLALCESLVDYTDSIKGDALLNEFWVLRGKAESIERHLADATIVLQRTAHSIRKELTKWQKLYLDKDQRGERIISSTGTMEPKVRAACSSIYYGHPGKPVALNIIPSQSSRKAIIIVTARKSNSLVQRLQKHQGQLSDLATIRDDIAVLLEREPERGIVHLAQNTLHFVLNKDDFDDPDILKEEERRAIAVSIANTLQ